MSPEATGLTVMCRDRRRTTRPEETSIRTGPTVPTTPSVILIPICCSGVAKNNPKYSKMTFLGLGLFVDVIKCGITTHDNYVGSGWSRDQDVGLRLWHWPTCTRRQWQRRHGASVRESTQNSQDVQLERSFQVTAASFLPRLDGLPLNTDNFPLTLSGFL